MHGFNKQLPAKLQSNQLPKKQDVQRDFLNYQCSQQAIFIALLLRHCKVVLAKPVKKCCVTHQFLRITTLIYPNNVELNVEKEVEQLCENKKQQDILDGVATKTADRRYKSNKRAESMNLLIKELKQFQYTFESRVTESKKNTSKLEIVYTISHKNQTFFDSEQIDSIGTDLNKYYTNILSSNKKSIVLNNDTYFFELLKKSNIFLNFDDDPIL
ncbi:TATA-binding protein-associated phosphoprotein [Entamoeba marina]